MKMIKWKKLSLLTKNMIIVFCMLDVSFAIEIIKMSVIWKNVEDYMDHSKKESMYISYVQFGVMKSIFNQQLDC
jgi:hypothetical protein